MTEWFLPSGNATGLYCGAAELQGEEAGSEAAAGERGHAVEESKGA